MLDLHATKKLPRASACTNLTPCERARAGRSARSAAWRVSKSGPTGFWRLSATLCERAICTRASRCVHASKFFSPPRECFRAGHTLGRAVASNGERQIGTRATKTSKRELCSGQAATGRGQFEYPDRCARATASSARAVGRALPGRDRCGRAVNYAEPTGARVRFRQASRCVRVALTRASAWEHRHLVAASWGEAVGLGWPSKCVLLLRIRAGWREQALAG